MSEFIVEIPVANPLKFTMDGAGVTQRASFDQRRFGFTQNAGMDVRIFKQLFEQADPLKPQFYTNFPLRKVRVLDQDEEQVVEYDPTLVQAYRGLFYRSQCKITSLNGKVFIYFNEGFEYTDSDFTVEGEYVSNDGRMPDINAVVGNSVRYRIGDFDIEGSVIDSIVWNSEIQAEGILLDVGSSISEPVDGVIEIRYDEKTGDLFEKLIDISALEGTYFIQLGFGITEDYEYTFTSEPIYIQEEHPDTLAIEYSHSGEFDSDDQWKYIYQGGFKNLMRLHSNHCSLVPSGEIEKYADDYAIQQKLKSTPTRQIIFRGIDLPSWIIDKFNLVFAHDSIIINEYQWENDDFGNFNIINRTDIGQFEINLKQKGDRTLFTKTFNVELTAEFDPDSLEDVVAAGAVEEVDFASNAAGLFHFVNLPDWITVDAPTFEDGDTIEITIAAGVLARQVTLIAVHAELDLTAIIIISQVAAATGLTSATPDDVDLEGESQSFEVVIDALPGTRWQVVTSDLWISGPSGVFEGDATIEIFVAENSVVSVRNSTVTIVNIDDETDTLTIEISQTAVLE